jgi:hypothetical protein
VTLTNQRPFGERLWTRRGVRALLLFAGLFAVYMANGKTIWSGDTLPMRYLPVSLLREGDFDLDEFPFLYTPGGSKYLALSPDHPFTPLRRGNLQLPYYLQHTGEHYVSVYPVAAAVLAVPVYLPSVLGGLSPDHKIFEVLEKVSAAAIVAVSAVLLYFALCRITTEGMALGLTLIYGLGTSSLSVSSQALWQHGPSQLALCGALYGAVRGLTDARWLGLLGFWLAFAVICRPTDILVVVPLVAYMAWQQRRHAYLIALGGLPSLIFQGWYDYTYFGNPLHSQLGGGAGFWSTSMLDGLSGLLFSPGRGLFIYSPIFLFSALALILSWWRTGTGLVRCLSIGATTTLLLYGKWFMWWGGHSYGPRLLADLAPVLVFVLYTARSWIANSRRVKALFFCAAFCSIYAHAVGAFVEDNRWNARVDIDRYPQRAWDWSDNPLTEGSSRLASDLERVVGMRW